MSRQWLSLVAAIWLQSISGTNSNFPAYSSQLKHLLSLSQLQLNNLAFASDAGKILAWFSGVAAAYLPLWLVLLIGSVIGIIGYGVQYLFLTNQFSSLPPYWLVFLLTVVSGNSICWINTVCYIVTIQNFPLDRQVALGLSTSYQGLTAKIYADIVEVVYSGSTSTERAKGYLLLNSILPVVVCVVSAPLIFISSDIHKSSYACSRKLSVGFIIMFMTTIGTGIYAVISSGLGYSIRSSSKFYQLIILIGFGVFIVVVPLVVPVAEKIREELQQKCWRRKTRVCNISTELSVEDLEDENGGAAVVEAAGENTNSCPKMEDEIGVKLMLKKVDFWLYFFVYLFGATLGLVYLNNLGQIAESRGYRTSTLVSISSSFFFFGRLIPSLLEYYVTRTKYKFSRAGNIALMMAPMCGAFFLLLVNNRISLYISTATISICTGSISSIAVSMTSEFFGEKGFGVNHNILITNIPIGSFLFGDLAALLYRRQVGGGRTGGQGDGGRCIGMKCYQTNFIIWGSLCFVGTLLALVLHTRTRKNYGRS